MSLLHIGLSLSPTWLRGSDWRRHDSRVEELFSPEFWIDAANLAEAAHLDFVLKPDALSITPHTIEHGVGFAGPDPLSIMAVLTGATERIGLIPTISTRFSESFDVARQLQTLDRFSRGRIGVNLVTSLGGSENYTALPASHDVYGDAHDYVQHLEALRATFPSTAVLLNRESGIFASPEQLTQATPHGRFVGTGPLSVPSVSAAPLPVVHAGASTASLAFAAEHAHAVFAMADTPAAAQGMRQQLAEFAQQHQRPAPLLCPGLALTLTSDPDAVHPHVTAARPAQVHHWSIIGTPETAAAEIMRWHEANAIDGFIALPMGSWESLRLFTTEVIPLLRAQGIFRHRYSGHTLHDHLTEGTP